MEESFNIKPIAHIVSDFPEKFGIPRQSGLVSELESTVVFEPEFQNSEAIRGLSDFSYIWLIWGFSKANMKKWSPTVRPPRLGGNKRMGVFATRSPFRPNSIGISSVKLLSIQDDPKNGKILRVGGADLMNATPIFDIKPYIPYTDSHPEALEGFSGLFTDYKLDVEFPNEILNKVQSDKRKALFNVLAQDPRPSYQNDSERIYGMDFSGYNIEFKVKDNCLTVLEVDAIDAPKD